MRLRYGDGVRTSLLRPTSEAPATALAVPLRFASVASQPSQAASSHPCRPPWCCNGRVMSDHRFVSMGARSSSAADRRPSIARSTTLRRTLGRVQLVHPAERAVPRHGSAGHIVLVSQPSAETLRVALNAAEDTQGGSSDDGGRAPIAGYMRDSSLLAADPRPPGPAWASSPVFALGRLIVFDPASARPQRRRESLAVDDALALLSGEGFALAGGHLVARGEIIVALLGGGSVSLRKAAPRRAA